MQADQSFGGLATFFSAGNDYNQIEFIARVVRNQMATVALVQVVKVTGGAGAAAIAGTVDIHPMVAQIDGFGNATPHGIIHNVPYVRWQGGANAVIIDPAVNDIGLALFASHDISSVKRTKKSGNPGSRRRFDWSDAIYLGGLLNGVPTQYVRFSADGIEINSPTALTINAPNVAINGNVAITGTLTDNGKNVGSTHTHGGVQTGGGTTGAPT